MQDLMDTETQPQISQVLDEGEQLIWAGRPDVGAMSKGRKRPDLLPGWLKAIITIVFVAGMAAIFMQDGVQYNQILGPRLTVALLVFSAIFVVFSIIKAKGRLKQWARDLTYGITDRRLLILRKGLIEKEFTLADVPQPHLEERERTPGVFDVIWAVKPTRRGTGSNRNRMTDLEFERRKIGFKALADADAVLKLIESWRQSLMADIARETETFVQSDGDDSAPETVKDADMASPASTLVESPNMGFSLAFPASWNITAGHKKLPFGKWGIEKETIWKSPDALRKWNAMSGKNDANTNVEIQVHKTAPINTLDKMLNGPGASGFGVFELEDKKPVFEVNGIQGFYFTQKSKVDGGGLSAMMLQGSSAVRLRQYVLHDGAYQYYIKAAWEQDAPGQEDIVDAIVATLKPAS